MILATGFRVPRIGTRLVLHCHVGTTNRIAIARGVAASGRTGMTSLFHCNVRLRVPTSFSGLRCCNENPRRGCVSHRSSSFVKGCRTGIGSRCCPCIHPRRDNGRASVHCFSVFGPAANGNVAFRNCTPVRYDTVPCLMRSLSTNVRGRRT